MQDLMAANREALREGISRSFDDGVFNSGQLVREQIEASDPVDYEMAALACMTAAEAVGASPRAALSGAMAMAFVSQMALVFTGLENSGGAASLSTAWGMPRSLNAGDAMFALAQESLFSASDELTADVRLQAAGILDASARDLMEALFALNGEGDPAVVGQRALLSSALALGGLLGGAADADRDRLAKLGKKWSGLPDEDLWRALVSDPATWLAT